jgi:hypothetical protein
VYLQGSVPTLLTSKALNMYHHLSSPEVRRTLQHANISRGESGADSFVGGAGLAPSGEEPWQVDTQGSSHKSHM